MTAENQNEGSSNEGADERNLSIQGSADESTIVVGDRNTIQHINVFSPITVGATTTTPSHSLSKQEYRWRQVLVDKVKYYWIDGVLRKSLHNQALIELGLEERSNAVASPLRGVGEFPDEPSRPFPEGTQATAIFDGLGAGRTLLILGDPGAGKTTTLLKLAQSLLVRIGDDLSQPIPVIFNLSSWGKKRQPIEKWLVQDLYDTFQVSQSLGRTWIEEEQLILCLDGLDEVAVNYRNACVKALNQFIQDHGRTEMVVCSRVRDYEALAERLRLQNAICVQALRLEQIDHYLERAGEQLTALKTVLNHNAEIKTFASSPLILSVMSLVYQGYSLDDFPQLDSTDDFCQRLFDAYINRMFQRRDTAHQYPKEQAKYWLIWIAQRMVTISQTVFLIERLQPSWLQTGAQILGYRLESALTYGIFFGLSSTLIGALTYGIFFGLSSALIGALTGALIGTLIGGLSGLLSDRILGDIQPVETIKWSLKETQTALRTGVNNGLLYGESGGLIAGLIIGLISVLSSGLITDLIEGLFIGLFIGLSVGLFSGLCVGLFSGLRGPEIQTRTNPNQGIFKSALNACFFVLSGGLIYGLMYGLLGLFLYTLRHGLVDPEWDELMSYVLIDWVPYELSFGWIFVAGLIFICLFAGLSGGGSACLRHLSLRLMLYRSGYSPWNYAHFLDYATERLFLQKVGGGYIFIHRMLLEHFAQMPLEQKRSK